MLHTLLYFLALFCLSTSANWAKLSLMPVEVLGFWRLGLASLIIFAWILYKKKAWPQLRDRNISWVVASGLLFFLHLATYTFAAKNTTISNTVILFASNPVWASVGAILFFNEKLQRRVVLSYMLAFLGIYLLVHKQIHFDTATFHGDLSAILSAVFYAAYMLASKRARRHYDNTVFAFFQFFICALCFGLYVLKTQESLVGYNSISWVSVAGLILLPTFLGHLTLTYLVNYMNITIISCGKLIEPVIASIIAFFIFHETLKEESWLAFALTVISVIILFAPGLWKRSQKIKNL